VSVTKDGDALVLANQQVAVKVPAPQEKAFDKPVAAETLPAPILAFRGPDGQWKGEGKLLLKRPVKKFAVTQTAGGPVFTETRYRLDYDGGYCWASALGLISPAVVSGGLRAGCSVWAWNGVSGSMPIRAGCRLLWRYAWTVPLQPAVWRQWIAPAG
jgi:hypothetical protein